MITTLYAGILGVLYIVLTVDTIKARRKNKISMGYGKNNEIIKIVSAHNNFCNYALFLLFLLFLIESSQIIPNILIHIIGGVFTLGRVLHYLAFKSKSMNFKFRITGMMCTIAPILISSVICIFSFLSRI